ncbi:uncharacterized protein LOC111271219 isoform X1 [Varroa jacobsoni]|uniref:uncharacterized protein LOC111271219 isoform X1 n=1 Tax=Varroa jacobsoni TaxID=62625 RepID=UPI000BF9EDF1|nr:uncharacterized protein LOC111271219 isoform X1 [Varroa jacobsoni]XP_022707620.1 uncharacterized protein LOC111271219 isoform X1 [Varroa jacobsoni]XP_022707622.1 uncharacterized protein LOC111271219 isoform X1 [Varroa jacobsoni]
MREVTGWALGGTLIALLLLMTSPGGDTFILPVVLFKHFPLYHHHKGARDKISLSGENDDSGFIEEREPFRTIACTWPAADECSEKKQTIGILPVPIPIPIKHLPRVKVRIQLGGKKKKTYYHHHVSDHQDWE